MRVAFVFLSIITLAIAFKVKKEDPHLVYHIVREDKQDDQALLDDEKATKALSIKAALADEPGANAIFIRAVVGRVQTDEPQKPLKITLKTSKVYGSYYNWFDHKPTFKLQPKDQEKVILTGGPLVSLYNMDQFHFHIFCTRKEAVESTLDRVEVPALLDMVFFRKKYHSYNNALKNLKDGLSVITIKLKVQEEENRNPEIEMFSSLVKDIAPNEDIKVPASTAIKKLTKFLLKGDSKYEAYRGKLVEPIQCKDCVDVYVMEHSLAITRKELSKFWEAPHCKEKGGMDWLL